MNMTKATRLFFLALAGLGLATLSSCNTTAGLGQDIEQVGDGIQDAAR